MFNCNNKTLIITFICLIFLSNHAHSSNWKREDNVECSIKTNHPELLASKPNCTSWSSSFQYQQTFYLKTEELLFYGRLQLAQPGYYWYNSGKIQKKLNQFNFIKNNVKFKKSNSNPVLSSNFWSRKPDNFDTEINNSKYSNLKCFGFWDGSVNSSSIGRRFNIYGMICNINGEDINFSKRKEYVEHIFINHKYLSVSPKPWIKPIKIENKSLNKGLKKLKIVKFIKADKRIFGNPSKVLNETSKLLKNAQEASQTFKNIISKSRTKILSRPPNKAVFGALPRSCNYRYTAWNQSSLTKAIQVAQDGCNLKIKEYNKLMNKSCQCSLFALNDTILVEADYFIGEVGYVPIIAEIEEKGQRIIIKGTVEFESPGKSISKFDLVNDKDIKICEGHFDINNKAKGSLFLDCFNGKYKGEGTFVNSGYDVEKRFMNGTAIIQLNENAIMRVIYGTDAL